MTVALVYDVHGNLPALEAVLADARDAGAGDFVLGGDYALFGPWPAETVDALRALHGATWIRGNGERWTAAPDRAPPDEVVQGAIAACREALGEATVAELAALPFDHVAAGTRYVHASPVSDVRSFPADANGADLELLEGVEEERVVFGHTHVPFLRHAGRVELVNPGSVGMPFDGDPRASYALAHPDGRVEHRRVPYDHEAAAAAVEDRFDGPWTATVARRIRTAAF